MNRYNTIRLEGPLHVVTTEDMKLGAHHKIPKIVFTITTDSEEVGGCHTVRAYGQLALEVLAFSLTWNESSPGKALSAFVEGRLQSVPQVRQDPSVRVISEKVTFYVHPEVRKEAVAKLKGLRSRYNGDADLWVWGRGGIE